MMAQIMRLAFLADFLRTCLVHGAASNPPRALEGVVADLKGVVALQATTIANHQATLESVLVRLAALEGQTRGHTASDPHRTLLEANGGHDQTVITSRSVKTCQVNATCDSFVTNLHVTGGLYYQNFLVPLPYTSAPSAGPSLAPTFSTPFSCSSMSDEGFSSGLYSVYPTGRSGTSYDVYCDMSTDGGGWMLTASYNRAAGDNADVVVALPTEPDSGYSHVLVNALSGYSLSDILEVRYFCTSGSHSRTLHFKTTTSFARNLAFTGDLTGNSASYWNSGFTPLDGHTANLPGATTYAAQSGSMMDHPFYVASTYHWIVRAGRFECDDYTSSNSYATKHLMYVRMAA